MFHLLIARRTCRDPMVRVYRYQSKIKNQKSKIKNQKSRVSLHDL